MSGGKGGEQTTTVDVPQWMEDAARQNIAMGQRVAGIGYMPYYGPDVAAFSPMQTAAMQNTANLASAFGMQAPTDVTAGMPQAQEFAGGLLGYSSQPLFAESTQQLREQRPQQYAQYMGLYPNIEPYGTYTPPTTPVTGGGTGPTFGTPSIYTNPERAAEVAQNYADGYMAMGGEESPYARPSTTQTYTPRTDEEINAMINQSLASYTPTLPDLSGYATKEDVRTSIGNIPPTKTPALPDLSKYATLEDVNRMAAGIPPVFDANPLEQRLAALEGRPMPTIPDVSQFATQADINRALAGIPQPVIPSMEGYITSDQLNKALAGLRQTQNLGIGMGMPTISNLRI